MLYGNGGGARGEIAAITAGGVVTLANSSDIVFFERDMMLQAKADDGTGAGAIRAGTDTIASVDRSAGTFTLTGAAVPAGWVVGDFMFQQGDIANVVTGLKGWLPTVAPVAGDAFFGLDRSG